MRHLAVQRYLGSSRMTHHFQFELDFRGDATAGTARSGLGWQHCIWSSGGIPGCVAVECAADVYTPLDSNLTSKPITSHQSYDKPTMIKPAVLLAWHECIVTKVGFKSSANCASALFGHLIFAPPMHDIFDFYCILVLFVVFLHQSYN